jgi:hypothetical protein
MWLQQLAAQLLPCDHVHVIFTVPDGLNVLWRFNRALFADLLLRAAQQSLAELLADPKYLGAKPGIISALHTWGRTLSVHPHAHCLVTAGGIDRNGQFVPMEGKTLLPARVLMAVFRGKLRHLLKTALDDGRLSVPPSLTVARTHSLLNRLGRVPWNVRIQERYRHGVSVAGYLARYITGGPISNRRIHAITSTEVAFWYHDHRDGGKKLLRLTPDEFLSRWFEHVPPKGLRTIRHSGIYSNSSAQKREHLRQQMLESRAEVPQQEPAPASPSVFLLEPERCPVCNTDVICRDTIVVRDHRPILRPPLAQLTQPP